MNQMRIKSNLSGFMSYKYITDIAIVTTHHNIATSTGNIYFR